MTADITDDAILDGRLRLYQPRRGHRFGHDAILLAAAVPAQPGERIAELGAGVGAASLALLARVPGLDATLIEIDAGLAALAAQNIVRNGFAGQARVLALDVAAPAADFAAVGIADLSFDHVLMNPPFNAADLQTSPDPARRRAHAAAPDTLRLWLGTAARLLRAGGHVTLIWRAQAQAAVLDALASDFGRPALLPVHPAPDKPAIRILVTAQTDAERTAPHHLAGLTLADAARRPSAEAERVLRGGASLALARASRPCAPAAPPSTTDAQKP